MACDHSFNCHAHLYSHSHTWDPAVDVQKLNHTVSHICLSYLATGPVRASGRNAPLIRFLILALYIVYIVCLFIAYASPVILFS